MKFGYTIIYVEDVKSTLQFYEKAFGFQQKFVTPENDYGELISGETTLAFASVELGNTNFKKGFTKSSKEEKPFGVEIVFVSENIKQDFTKAIEMGAEEFEPLTQKPWGQKVGYLRDNNGILIEVCTPVNIG